MKRVLLATLGAMLALVAHLPAQAAEACKTTGSVDAGLITSTSLDPQVALIVSISAGEIIKPEAVAAVSRATPCERQTFKIGEVTYTLTGENDDAQARRAVPDRAEAPLFYLQKFMNAAALLKQGVEGAPPGWIYGLVRAQGADAAVLMAFTDVPRDDLIRLAVTSAPSQLPPPMVTIADGDLKIEVQGPGQGPRPAGPAFSPVDGGGLLHAASGFTCAASFAGVPRNQATEFDPSEGGRDVGCGYGARGGRGAYTVYLTKIANASHGEVFDAWRDEARRAAPSDHSVKPPLAPGRAPLPTSAAFWADHQDLIQGLWVSKIGDWHVKLRATFQPGNEREATAVAKAVFEAFYAEVKGGQAAAE